MPEETTEYRARPIPEDGLLSHVKKLYSEQRVVVESKNIFKSFTMWFNGFLFVAASVVAVLDIVFGANIIEPIVRVFTDDPDAATRVLAGFTQVYTVLNIVLRLKTTAPVTVKTETKEEAIAQE